MKIERKSGQSIIFKELKDGDIFIDIDGGVCMKVKASERPNTVTLEYGILFHIDDNEVVRLPKSAKLIVEE